MRLTAWEFIKDGYHHYIIFTFQIEYLKYNGGNGGQTRRILLTKANSFAHVYKN